MAKIDRRDFLRWVGAGGAGVGAGLVLGEVSKKPTEFLIPYPVPPEEYMPGIDTWYRTLCQGCGARCGIQVRVREGRVKKIEGNPVHPVSQGGLCARGQAGPNALYHPDRLREPLVSEDGKLAPTSWARTLSQLANRFRQIESLGRGDDIHFITGSGSGHLYQLFGEFLAAVGSTHLHAYQFADTHNLATANRRCFGTEQMPYYDIGNASLVVSFGADVLCNWLSPVHYSQAYGSLRQGHEHRGRWVQVEPRLSVTGANADQWLPARPGTEALLALSMAHEILAEGGYDGADRGEWETLLAAHAPSAVAEKTGIKARDIHALAVDFATARGLAVAGDGALAGSNGYRTAVAVNLLNHLVGNIGHAGGILMNPAAVIPSPPNRQAAFATMTELVQQARQGRVEALILHDTNPAFDLPPETGLRAALESIPLVIVMAETMTETAALADVVLPISSYLETWNGEAPDPGVGFTTASLAQPVVRPRYESRPAGDILIELAKRLGDQVRAALPWVDTEDYLRYRWRRLFRERGGEDPDFENFWQEVLSAGVWGQVDPPASAQQVRPVSPQVLRDASDPIASFTGKERDFPLHFLPYLSPVFSDGRWAHLPWLQELPDPITGIVYHSWLEINPQTAQSLGLENGQVVHIESPLGQLDAPVLLTQGIRPDVVAMAIGQGHSNYGRYANGHGVNPIEILAPATDTDTGALAWAATRVRLRASERRVRLTTTSGNPRALGRQILKPADNQHG